MGISALFLAFSGALFASTQLVHAPFVSQGGALFVMAIGDVALEGSRVQLVYKDGSMSPLFPAYDPGNGSRYALLKPLSAPDRRKALSSVRSFLLGIYPDAMPGPAALHVYSARGEILASTELDVRLRVYIAEDIRLTPTLTSLRADPDPVKQEQTRRYAEILATVNPLGVYLDAPFIKPVTSERRTSFFGDRRRYIYSTGSISTSVHAGIDYGIAVGTPLVAAGRGRVVMAEDRIVTGKTVILEHLPGVYSIYMHMDSIAVARGQVVPRGSLIGASGKSGLATGPHLHWELRIAGIPSDPEAFAGIDNFPEIGTMVPTLEGG